MSFFAPANGYSDNDEDVWFSCSSGETPVLKHFSLEQKKDATFFCATPRDASSESDYTTSSGGSSNSNDTLETSSDGDNKNNNCGLFFRCSNSNSDSKLVSCLSSYRDSAVHSSFSSDICFAEDCDKKKKKLGKRRVTYCGNKMKNDDVARPGQKNLFFPYMSSAKTLSAAMTADSKFKLWDSPSLFFRILSFCNCYDICSAMPVCKKFYQLSTSNTVWKRIFNKLNLRPLIKLHETTTTRTRNYYRYFVEKVLTTEVLYGCYSFESAASQNTYNVLNTSSDDNQKNDKMSSTSSVVDESAFTFRAVRLFISRATLGQMNHAIGRAQLFIEYKDSATETLQGVARFSWSRGCFFLCCAPAGSTVRGPVFTVVVKNAEKPWPDEAREHFEACAGGLSLVMTPALLEGLLPGSRITETDILCVTRLRESAERVART